MPLDADHIPINVGREPLFDGEGIAGCNFYISEAALDLLRDSGPEWKVYDAALIRQSLANPLAIFQGLRRAQYEDGYCYSSKPDSAAWQGDEVLSDEEKAKYVFLVFVKKDQGLIVFDWAWRRECQSKVGHPQDWERDFEKGKVWPPQPI